MNAEHCWSMNSSAKDQKEVLVRWYALLLNVHTALFISILNQIDDLAITNNRDSKKVLATVAAIILNFTERFHDMSVYAMGSTPARTRLYQMGIVAHYQEIEKLLIIYGYKNNEWQPFKKGVAYEAFAVRRK